MLRLHRLADPQAIDWKGKRIVIKEAWIEKETERNHTLNPFAPRYLIGPSYYLCFNLSEGWDFLWQVTGKPPFFVLEGERSSVGQIGTVVLFAPLEKIDPAGLTILCTDNWKLNNSIRIKVTPHLQAVKNKK